MYRRLPVLLAVVLSAGLLTVGCNIFDWAAEDDPIAEGNALMREGDYAAAAEQFAKAMDEDPENSDARYYHAKAVIHASGFNALRLGSELEEDEFASNDLLPFFGDNWPDEKANRLFGAVRTAVDDLRPIWDGKTHGNFGPRDIDLDLALLVGMRSILQWRDIDFDGTIGPDDFQFDIEWFEGFNADGFALKKLAEYISADKSAGDADLLCNPAHVAIFNELVDSVSTNIDFTADVLTQILSDSVGVDIDVDVVKEMLGFVKDVAHMYKVNDGDDNDYDGQYNEEEIDLIDNDGDGWIDEDSQCQEI
ncbi:MAG TPA: tetratricopeptide repeat protein [candidate division Zixibacteria bacterium]|nr:tetratricopeptide repeat protein [candidate division Zixibacteria bacterium]